MGETRRRMLEQRFMYGTLAVLALFFFFTGHFAASVTCVLIALLNLPLMLLWAAFLCTFVSGLLTALLAALWVVPMQALPALPNHQTAGKQLYSRAIVSGILMFLVLFTYVFDQWPVGLAVATCLLLSVLFGVACLLGLKLRAFIREQVTTMLLLPALKVMETTVAIAPGQSAYVHEMVESIRAHFLNDSEPDPQDQGRVAFWTGVKVASGGGEGGGAVGGSGSGGTVGNTDGSSVAVGAGGNNNTSESLHIGDDNAGGATEVVLDAAYLRHPDQCSLPASEQRWVLWFLGNGELFEFALTEVQVFSARSGLNIFVFNYRGAGHSSGYPHCAEDLVSDGVIALQYLTRVLGARHNHIILFGHSLGGAIAPLVRAEVYPDGAIVSERSFATLGAAARGVLLNVFKSLTGITIPLPQTLVQGLLNSVFKGHLNVLSAWKSITGPKLIIYHQADAIIPYKSASLHYQLLKYSTTAAQSIELGSPGSLDFHNAPLRKYAEYNQVLSRCRTMVGLTAELPQPCTLLLNSELQLGGLYSSSNNNAGRPRGR